ncbi:MAG: hypothetical protein MUE60_03865, partial [Candidatus Eisenbacteria bacterium]|nr:hypothetical protein [Candidatus Eisenbacteria bacterium]
MPIMLPPLCLAISLACGTDSAGTSPPYYFYQGLDYGSECLVNPLALILNGGYGIMQMDNRPNNPFEVEYSAGARNLWHNLRDPIGAVRRFGWSDFIFTEVIPASTDDERAHYWPNYTQHLIGGGMSYRLMAEWYRFHGFRFPRAAAFATIWGYHLLNEVVENGPYEGVNVDPIADIYIFDPISMVLFSSEAVCRFFSERLNMADWSYQFGFDPWRKEIYNNGQNIALRYRIPGSERYSVFYCYGIHGELGVSYRRDDGTSISFGAGLVAKSLTDIGEDSSVRKLTASLVPTAGVFYDRNNSLMASVLYS